MNYPKNRLEDYVVSLGEKKFKATQIYEWVYQKKVYDFDNFLNVGKSLINKLKEDFKIEFIKIEKVLEGPLVHKFLFRLLDGEKIEAVLMEHDYGLSVCVSSEVGCNMGCAFCESGRLKKVRNLETYEMVQQIILIEDYIKKKISRVVIMGIGEPLDNYDMVINFIKIINDPKALAIGSRHITLSTCGIIPKIKEFMDLNWQVNLAISLHASTNVLRDKLMPINKVYNLKELMSVLKEYLKKTNRRVTIEYVMLNMVNDKEEDALNLSKLLKGMNVYVNLIPYNETAHLEFSRSKKENVDKFFNILKKNNINVTIRKEFGGNIKAACGQLRSESD